ncbi:MAG: hypothetical protein H7Y13_10570, partial [Sphingobacteriaceae bacterium]|nr:hypothetical protein [Sphingobacteriaceae bacterium]
MKKTLQILSALTVILVVMWQCSTTTTDAVYNNQLPQDAMESCTVTQDSFKTWFANDTISENGLVTPANSVAFPHRNNCDFYQWSERMFLWITSTDKGRLVLESPVFYGVSPADSAGNRTFIPHTAGSALRMTSSIRKHGPNRLPVMKDKQGRLFEVENVGSAKNETSMVKDATGKTVQVAHLKIASGTIQFIDKSGKIITRPKAIIKHSKNRDHIVHQFNVGKKSIFLDASGNIIESESGQATGDALMTQNGSLVYYLTMANDVYAWYLTGGLTNGNIDTAQFPTTAAQRNSICAYARKNGVVLPDSNALAMEIKSSWVEAATITKESLNNYVTVQAVIPTYTKSDSIWVPSGEKTATMALVGMHVVGSVAGHPEMIWSTFEHKNNAPNAAYDYLTKDNKVKVVPQDGGGGWLFSSDAADTAANISHITNIYNQNTFATSDTLFAKPNQTISASNTQRLFPFGVAMGHVPNPEDKSSAASNSELISINNAIQRLLVGNDVRKNYL